MGFALVAAVVLTSGSVGWRSLAEPKVQLNLRASVTQLATVRHHNWQERSSEDLFDEYSRIFPHGNRNAASHRWASFLLDRSSQMTAAKLGGFFKDFCPVSGSPLSNGMQWHYTLQTVTGSTESGSIFHCCWPCVCDTLSWLKVDTKTVETSDGPQQFSFLVIGNPCLGNGAGQIPAEAPDVWCEGHELAGATISDNGYVIFGMLHQHGEDGTAGSDSMGNDIQGKCQQRETQGFQSGMGQIFIEVANISPIHPPA